MKKIFSFLILATLTCSSQSEDQIKKYNELILQAQSAYQLKDYKKAAFTYLDAFKASGGATTELDMYNAACSWAMAGYPDSAFKLLNKMAFRYGYKRYERMKSDNNFSSLYNDARWQPLLDSVHKNQERAESKMDKNLVELLKKVINDDQRFRAQIPEIEKKYTRESQQMKDIWDSATRADKVNLEIVTRILNERGWLGPDEVGEEGSAALFFVIQHADPQTQEKYLPMMREAVKQNKATRANLALLEDRVALNQGKKQMYGSQLQLNAEGKYVFSPIEGEDNVNKRRAEVGLEPIEEYAKRFGLTYSKGQSQLPGEDMEMWDYLMWGAGGLVLIFLLLKFLRKNKTESAQ